MKAYVLSLEAEADVIDIFDYSEHEFGFEQAVQYLTDMEKTLENLLDNPFSGRERKDIRADLFSIPYVSHVIFYRVLSDEIRVVRILHASRDQIKYLDFQ
jgi:toxin ParE1/3/4